LRHILHADFDAFYASVEQRDNPELRGKPVVVGGSPEGRGVVASASYESRRFGVRSAMPMRTAFQRCPQTIRIAPRFELYGQVSRQLMAILREMADLVEPLSLDEAYMDVTGSVAPDRPPGMIATELRARVRAELGLTISVGVATSKSVAKIASDMNKPDGMTVVPPDTEREFLAPLGVEKLWGIGPKTAARLKGEGINTIGELASRPAEWWLARFGRTGPHLRRLTLGEDDSPVVEDRERKSVSAETTLAHDTGDPDILLELTDRLSQRVAHHLTRNELRGRTVKLKLRLSDFTTFTRQTTVAEPVASPGDIARAAGELLRRELEPGRRFRLVGVGVSGFERPEESPLQPRLEGFE
jgi:DNA polymerase-4